MPTSNRKHDCAAYRRGESEERAGRPDKPSGANTKRDKQSDANTERVNAFNSLDSFSRTCMMKRFLC
jgi:hypothetical protein